MIWVRRGLFVAADAAIAALAIAGAFWLRFDGTIPDRFFVPFVWSLPLAAWARVLVLAAFRTYRRRWRYAGASEFVWLGFACLVGSAVLGAAVFGLASVTPAFSTFPRSVIGIDLALVLIGVGGSRLLLRAAARRPGGSTGTIRTRDTLVIGAGDAGAQLVRAIQEDASSPYRIVGFVDDDALRQGTITRNVRVLGPRKRIPQLAKSLSIDAILIAFPSASPGRIRETVELAREAGVREIKTIPTLSELYGGRVTPSELRELRPEDLLRREPVRIEGDRIRTFLQGRPVLVTGAAGSIGSELCRQALAFGVSRLVALDFDETGLFDLEADLRRRFPRGTFEAIVCDVRDAGSLSRAFLRAEPQVVYHAAAYKHVPLMEAFPAEAAKTNIFGTQHVLQAATDAGCEAFVLISTDKAVNPTSVMGATKRVAEMMVQSCRSDRPRCIAVRFGNVLGSRGSVLGTFQRQVQARQPVTVTDPDMRRYFMVTSEAVQLVLQASALGETGDVLVLDMGEPVRIVELAKDVIRFHGLEPDVDIPIVYTGSRPGEKLYEDLFTDAEGQDATTHERVFVARLERPGDEWGLGLDSLRCAAAEGNPAGVVEALRRLVPTYGAGLSPRSDE